MTKEEIMKRYKFSNIDRLDEYLKFCRSNGWKEGTGVDNCDNCIYHATHSNTGNECNYLLDTSKRRPCPPWDCTVRIEGRRKRKYEKEREMLYE